MSTNNPNGGNSSGNRNISQPNNNTGTPPSPPVMNVISLVDSLVYSAEPVPIGKNSIQFKPSNADSIRYRLGKTRMSLGEGYVGWTDSSLKGLVYAWSDFSNPQVGLGGDGLTSKETFNLKLPNTSRAPQTFFAANQNLTNNGYAPSENWLNSINNSYTEANESQILGVFNEPGNSENVVYTDHFVSLIAPMSSEEYSRLDVNNIRVPTVDVDVRYNYYQRDYENATSDILGATNPVSVPETFLPSFYSMLISKKYIDLVRQNQTQDSSGQLIRGKPPNIQPFYKQLTLNDRIEAFKMTTLLNHPVRNRTTGMYDLRDITTIDSTQEEGNFFSEYSYALMDYMRDPNFTTGVFQSFIHQVINPADFQDLNKDLVNKDSFPMYVSLRFSTDDANQSSDMGNKAYTHFVNDFVNSHFLKALIEDYIGIKTGDQFDEYVETAYISGGEYREAFFNNASFNFITRTGLPFAPDNVFEGANISEGTEVLDFSNWMENWAYRNGDWDRGYKKHVVIGNEGDDPQLTRATGQYLPNGTTPSSEYLDIYKKYEDLIYNTTKTNVFRTFKEIINGQGQRAQKYTLFYKIEKWEVDADGNPTNLLQNFYVPNTDEFRTGNSSFEFIDSQVKYAKRYIYRIYSFMLIFGTEYYYQNNLDVTQLNDIKNDDGQELFDSNMCVFTRPSVKVVAIPYLQKEVAINDRPPMFPDVNIVPYQNVNDKLLFLLRSNVGNYFDQPIEILPGDREIFDSVRKALGIEQNRKINFYSDDVNTNFQVFKLEAKPRSYQDFFFGDNTIVNAGQFKSPSKLAGSCGFVDSIKPNKKYYYTFRSIDPHGNISNPSPVYEVELSYDGASSFLLMDIINFENTRSPARAPTKNLKKYLRIRPAYSQTLVNPEKSDLIDPSTGQLLSPYDVYGQSPAQIPTLGPEHPDAEYLWNGGKNFKIRVVSKKTGRKIDFKLKFDLKNVVR